MANAVLIGIGQSEAPAPLLRVAELFAGLVTGIGGSRVLTSEVDKLILKHENKALTETKDALASVVGTLAQEAKHV